MDGHKPTQGSPNTLQLTWPGRLGQLTVEDFRRLHFAEGKSTVEIASLYEVLPFYLRSWCRKNLGRSKQLRGKLSALSVEDFRRLYFEQKESLEDIGQRYEVSRVAVWKWFQRHESFFSEDLRQVGRVRNDGIMQDHFTCWTPAMAYVLGVLATDGCVSRWRVTLTSTDRDLVEKVKSLIECRDPIRVRQPSGYSRKVQHILDISSIVLVERLTKLGITARKSRTLRFPEMPEECVRHFIRGCWDGDGSFFTEAKKSRALKASFISGSREFIKTLVGHLEKAGIGTNPVWTQKMDSRGIYRAVAKTGISIYVNEPNKKAKTKNPSYYIRLSHNDALRLGHWFYDGVPETMRMERKQKVWERVSGTLPSSGGP
ncbi:MAG: hypothetical protein M1453_12175 [Acidobacteria bacterium]|nr:hypothetical protein [Acidobacteriota bacterium]MCL5288735.1 hypothetical protein [Acidobacteriota bacterium]